MCAVVAEGFNHCTRPLGPRGPDPLSYPKYGTTWCKCGATSPEVCQRLGGKERTFETPEEAWAHFHPFCGCLRQKGWFIAGNGSLLFPVGTLHRPLWQD